VDKKDWDPLVRLFVSGDISGLGYEDHLAYEAAVRDKYLPDTPVSEELKSYLDELLKDADVIHHCFNDVSKPVKEKEQARYDSICKEFGF
jgi:hypothetical protein